ncbi:MAG: DNA mismatch repair endonuclease MutL [Planctomycetota bacterium]|nr:DNA mismatch repair endonuclease MutL [Planctomycetota bacterium]
MAVRILPIHLVNKIAAGEVIERPASIVKELLENAVDAGATRIDVAIENGGGKLIAVSDNGCGMSAEDLAMAFAPHATSKITNEEDLYHINTMGFRGEALASAASVAHAHIRTRRRDDGSGHEVEASGGNIAQVRPCSAGPGTTVTVRDLFFNTPARRKFLRTANTEFGHVSEQLARLALPHPTIAFRLSHNGREVQNLPAVNTTCHRIGDLFGAELADSLIPITERSGKVSVNGFIASPSAARASGKWQYFFLNGRYIRDRLLGHALREAYRGLLEASRWPVAFIFLELDPADVDVNVHPTKIEVRFHNGQLVHGELLAALKETLNKANLTPTVSPPAAGEVLQEADNTPDDQHRQSLRKALADFFRSPSPQPQLGFPARDHRAGQHADRTPQKPIVPTCPPPRLSERPDEAANVLPAAIQVHDTYIVTADADGLVIIDQHALHERLIYNDLKARLAEGTLTGQRLLIPQTLRVTDAEADVLAAHGELLRRLGIELASFGPQTCAIQKFPSLLAERGAAPDEFVREILDKLTDDQTTDPERLLGRLLEVMACKAAVKAGDKLSDQEIRTFLAYDRDAEKTSSCPHGRPTTLRLTVKDLEKQFKRT